MSRYRRIDVSVWRDRDVRKLTDDGRTLWFYLLTSPQTTPPGIYILSRDVACRDLGWDTRRFVEVFDELLATLGESRVRWDPDNLVIFLPNWLRYNAPTNQNSIKSWSAILEAIPEESPLNSAWYLTAERMLEPMRDSIRHSFRELFSPRNRSRIQDQDPPLPPRGGSSEGSIEDRIWRLYIRSFEEHRGGAWPGHSEGKHQRNAKKIRNQAEHLIRAGGGEVTDEGILRMVQRFLPLHFASQDRAVIESDYTLGMFAARWNRYADQWSEMR